MDNYADFKIKIDSYIEVILFIWPTICMQMHDNDIGIAYAMVLNR